MAILYALLCLYLQASTNFAALVRPSELHQDAQEAYNGSECQVRLIEQGLAFTHGSILFHNLVVSNTQPVTATQILAESASGHQQRRCAPSLYIKVANTAMALVLSAQQVLKN